MVEVLIVVFLGLGHARVRDLAGRLFVGRQLIGARVVPITHEIVRVVMERGQLLHIG